MDDTDVSEVEAQQALEAGLARLLQSGINDGHLLRALPKSVREIAEVIGIEQTIHLLAQLPAYQRTDRKTPTLIMYVPKKLPLDHELIAMIGYRDAQKLVRVFGGEILYPCTCKDIFRIMRDEAIRRMIRLGARAEVVAGLFGMTERNVRNIIGKKQDQGLGGPKEE